MRYAALVLLAASFFAPACARAQDCPDTRMPSIAAPHLARALARHHRATIVAFGSSSTEGWRASDPQHSYPADLQRLMAAAFPTATLTILNRGVGGQDAPEEVARLAPDVIAIHPDLVVWQVGANAVLKHESPADFRDLVDHGLDELRIAGIDVVLMDNQRAPMIVNQSQHEAIETTLAALAEEHDIPLFARGELMDLWQEEGHPYAEFLAGDGVHHNDRGYACVAGALAQSLEDGLSLNVAAR